MGAMQQFMMAGASSASGSYLDSLAVTPRACFSLRKLISTATVCCRVRRSDNAEQDIGFSGNSIDTAALLSFCGATNGFVTKWYDQTGNAEHLEQATTTKQPQIVSAGSHFGSITFNGSAFTMTITSLTLGTPQVGIYTRGKYNSTGGAGVFCEMTTNASSNSGTFLIYNNAGAFLLDSYNTAGTNRARSYTTVTTTSQETYLLNRATVGATELSAYTNGTIRTASESATTEQTGNYATNDMYLGSRGGTVSYGAMDRDTFVIYNADTASIRSSIEAIVA